MTTCRSDRCLVVCFALAAGFAPAAAAQDPARPATHTVRRGDTLWDLARQYLGDPFLWPQIYRLNTDIVADPHWIYPGEVLRLAAGAETRAVPEAGEEPAGDPAPAPRYAADPDQWTEEGALFPRRRRAEVGSSIVADGHDAYRALNPGDFYASGFLTEGDALPFGTFVGTVEPMQIPVMVHRRFTLLNDLVAVQPPNGATYQVGDTLLVVMVAPGFSGQPQWGDMIKPTGLVVVTEVGDGRAMAMVRGIYGEMRNGQQVLPAERFVSSGTARPREVDAGVSGRVIMAREGNPIRHPQDILFLDVGRADGVAPGDLFAVLRDREGDQPERIATLQVVHSRQRTATVRVIALTAADFPVRAAVRQVATLGR